MLGNMSPLSLLLILLIVLILFGGKRLRNIGKDLGNAIKNFRSGLNEGEEKKEHPTNESDKNKPDDK